LTPSCAAVPQIGSDIPQLGVAFAAAKMVSVHDMQHLMGDHAHGLLDTVAFTPLGVEPDTAPVRRHGADVRRIHPCQSKRDGADEGRPDEQSGARLGDDRWKLFHGGLTQMRPACA
jgi:hypothetical protein